MVGIAAGLVSRPHSPDSPDLNPNLNPNGRGIVGIAVGLVSGPNSPRLGVRLGFRV